VNLDVMVCGAWNRCGKYIVIPQKRLAFDARGNLTGITTIANDVIPIYVCESSGFDSSDYKPPPPPPPPESSGSSVGGQFATDAKCYLCLKGSVPDRLWVTIDNMLNRDCPECLQQQIYEYAAPLALDPFTCYWATYLHPLCGNTAHLSVLLYESGGRLKLLGELTVSGASYAVDWEADVGTAPIDCSTINVWLPFKSQDGTLCDAALSRLRVRAH
jgi:hypothetical protein